MTPSKIEGGVPEWALKRVQELSAPLSNDPDFEINERFPTVIAFARYIAEHEEEPVDPHSGALGLACGEVADAVFYHMSDVQHRSKLALALLARSEEIRRGGRDA